MLPELDERLEEARVRWFTARLSTGALWTLAATAVAIVSLLLLVGDPSVRLLRLVGFGVLGIGLLASAVRAWRTTPSLQEAARIAERMYGLRTQLSTARELGASPSAPARRILHDALLADARRLSDRLDPRRLAPYRLGRLHFAAAFVALVAVASAALLATQPDELPPPTVRAAGPEASFDPAGREALADELERLADAVGAEADRENDPYAAALAEAARDLAQGLRATGDTAGVTTRADIETLLGHLTEALGPRFAFEPPAAPDEAPIDLAPLAMPGGPEEAGGIDAGGPAPERDELLDRVEALRERLEEVQASRMDNPYGEVFDPGDRVVNDAVRDSRAAQVAPGEGAGAPAGAAERSSDAPGDAAGAGAADLAGGASEETPDFASTEEVVLPEGDGSRAGARVRAAGDPSGEEAEGAVARAIASRSDDGGSDAPLEAAPAREESVRDEAGGWRRHDLAPAARLLASRLLAPDAEEAP